MSRTAECYRWANREGAKVGFNALRVLVELVTYANLRDGLCFPSRTTLAKNIYDVEEPARWQLTRVSEALRDLEAAGLIRRNATRRENGSTTSTNYEILFPPTAETPSPQRGEAPPLSKGSPPPLSKGPTSTLSEGRLEVSNLSIPRDLSTERAPGGIPPGGEAPMSKWEQKRASELGDKIMARLDYDRVDELEAAFRDNAPGDEHFRLWVGKNYKELGLEAPA